MYCRILVNHIYCSILVTRIYCSILVTQIYCSILVTNIYCSILFYFIGARLVSSMKQLEVLVSRSKNKWNKGKIQNWPKSQSLRTSSELMRRFSGLMSGTQNKGLKIAFDFHLPFLKCNIFICVLVFLYASVDGSCDQTFKCCRLNWRDQRLACLSDYCLLLQLSTAVFSIGR